MKSVALKINSIPGKMINSNESIPAIMLMEITNSGVKKPYADTFVAPIRTVL